MPVSDSLSPPLRLLVGITAGLLLFSCAAFALTIFLGLGQRGEFVTFINGPFFLVPIGLAAVLALLRATLIKVDQSAWVWIGIGVAAIAAAELYLSTVPDPYADYPALADALFLGNYAFLYAGLLAMLWPHFRRAPRGMKLDGLIVILGTSAATAAFILPRFVVGDGEDLVAAVISAAYPVADLILGALVLVAFALFHWKPGRLWGLIALFVTCFVVADVVFLYREIGNGFADGTWVDALWPLGLAMLALASWQDPPEAGRVNVPNESIHIVPTIFGIAALGLLIYDHWVPQTAIAVFLAVATLVAAGVRSTLVLRHVRDLSESTRLAETDDLTGLINRRGFFNLLDERLGSQPVEPFALLLVDLNKFKEFNDALGHQTGDRLLELVGPRLQRAVVGYAKVARLGGDEFAVISDPGDAAFARKLARRLSDALEDPFEVAGASVHVTASIGVALFPDHGNRQEVLVRNADAAMYTAKARHEQYVVFKQTQGDKQEARLFLLEELRRALDRDELQLSYQPKFDLATGRMIGAEALLRWDHPRRGLIGPNEFIPAAEQTELMRPLTRYVIRKALQQISVWQRQNRHFKVAVNISVANLLDAEFPGQIVDLLEQTGVDPSLLILEVTETLVMIDPKRAGDLLAQLGELGVDLALDDFGTGHSSLAYLKQLPVNELKIDRSFVSNLGSHGGDRAIVKATIELAHALGLTVVGEGVEDQETLTELIRLGCDVAQGYYLGRPQSPGQIEAKIPTSGPFVPPQIPPIDALAGEREAPAFTNDPAPAAPECWPPAAEPSSDLERATVMQYRAVGAWPPASPEQHRRSGPGG